MRDYRNEPPIGRCKGVVQSAWARERNEQIEQRLHAERDARKHPPIERTPLDDPEALERERRFYGEPAEDVQA